MQKEDKRKIKNKARPVEKQTWIQKSSPITPHLLKSKDILVKHPYADCKWGTTTASLSSSKSEEKYFKFKIWAFCHTQSLKISAYVWSGHRTEFKLTKEIFLI